MPSPEQKIKAQFSKNFKKADWGSYKLLADYYFKNAAIILKKDINADEVFKLLIRNTQKRLFLGVGCELLLKACYLKHGFAINKFIGAAPTNPYRISQVRISQLNKNDTLTLNYLIQNLQGVKQFNDWATIERGLIAMKVFRNKEGHMTTLWHKFNPDNYLSIENAIISLYEQAFEQTLRFKIAMTDDDKGEFLIAD